MLEYCSATQSPKGGDALLQYVTVHVGIHGFPQWTVSPQCWQHSCSPPTMALPQPCWTPGCCPHTLNTSLSYQVYLGLIRPQEMVPVIHVLSLLVFINCLQAFLCIIFRRRFLLGRHADQFDTVCGVWSEHWQADLPPLLLLQQCWQDSYVYFSIHNLWIWCWTTCTQLLWSTMARPVEPLYGLGHSAADWFSAYLQSSYSLSHLYVEQQFLFSDPQRVLCHEVPCWTSSDQYERVRVITTNWTHLLPIHTWDFGTLTSRMPQEEKMANWAQFWHFHLGVYSLLWPAV